MGGGVFCRHGALAEGEQTSGGALVVNRFDQPIHFGAAGGELLHGFGVTFEFSRKRIFLAINQLKLALLTLLNCKVRNKAHQVRSFSKSTCSLGGTVSMKRYV